MRLRFLQSFDNIQIFYLLAFLQGLLFSQGIWQLYYLRFTDYSGIGLLEAVLLFTALITEIPTGALGDVIGRRRMMIVSTLLVFASSIFLTFAPSIFYLLVSMVFYGLGLTFASGSREAFIYDFLKMRHAEEKYDAVLAKANTLSLIAVAVGTLLGGFFYHLWFRLPFLAEASVAFLTVFIALAFIEPKRAHMQFAFVHYAKQNLQGFVQLLSNFQVARLTIYIVITTAIFYVFQVLLNQAQAMQYGFNEVFMGILASTISVLAAFFSYLTLWFKRFGYVRVIVVLPLIISLLLIVSPYIGIAFGGVFIILRTTLRAPFDNIASVLVNSELDSQHRATALSTLYWLIEAPYIVIFLVAGKAIANTSSHVVALFIGILLFVTIIVFSLSLLIRKFESKRNATLTDSAFPSKPISLV
ncbi:MAG: hypothetical protein A3B74_01025 [Candidatus Kerfeldbacteria bacterium RIFCSPHIGHO2_02_FULL_42_14]|uniref:Major facilitator superfamily (MFS) profile domain-containing protein n=1 Tax=Candidatus Kerfeldbacteria bacterium RIFCSPHIGHO2_02_FULL_42_14 TaxID=1798540 RepID=A0A1G2ASD4_9BACT|nr:MAG: hypothetical protein A3B74_01025 [Candidatus Kerfeldbacteria bacterium RIFCSPHIGHO2_02_FULL_42_14]OGY81934.1 MAG: hypothetical protein A3E60_01105 [Candidatus Kerfeldbacteria bacterium RIFCSPHIGHO2_12_FULL_42_13]OGY83431.1 MAG: hypothetical protein A3I91_02150 [Candidatus Kerfeldbacteria bacterium RIFCSPLOWO2_02_FULL_42_19]OGY85559.1 MAG: hypothetical protein A3G01_03670 [Candidatus Kerfeldbacteria bacterium RIFCSPLOWO2_12_FULL_43_9]